MNPNPELQSIMDQVDVDLNGYDQPDAEETRYFTLDGTEITEEEIDGSDE